MHWKREKHTQEKNSIKFSKHMLANSGLFFFNEKKYFQPENLLNVTYIKCDFHMKFTWFILLNKFMIKVYAHFFYFKKVGGWHVYVNIFKLVKTWMTSN